jgi:hypothetical protein
MFPLYQRLQEVHQLVFQLLVVFVALIDMQLLNIWVLITFKMQLMSLAMGNILPNFFMSLYINGSHNYSLGAIHDGAKSNTKDATSCPGSLNNIMTSVIGQNANANPLFYFSNCSIKAFKSTLLNPDNTVYALNIQYLF